MKKFSLIVMLLVQGTALAQSPQPIRLKEAVADFPRNQLQLKTTGPISLQVNQGDRAAYEMLAEIAGLNIVIDPDFRNSSNGPFQIQNADILQAFDLLSARTGSFVEVLNSNTIIVAPDNPTKRRDYEVVVLKTFYLPTAAPPQRLTDIITTLRTTLQARYIFASPTANAVVMRDNLTRIAAAEKIIGAAMPLVTGPAAANIGETIPSGGHILTLENGVVHDSAPAHSMLELTAKGRVSFDLTESTHALFERLAQAAGLNVIFDTDFRSLDGPKFKVDNLDILDAMDVLALQTRALWEPVDSKTILVAPDSQVKRRDFENLSLKTFYLPNTSQVEMVDIITALRTLLNARYLATVADSKAIVMRDNANKLALAERIISDLRKANGVVVAAGFPLGSEAGFILSRRAARTIDASLLPQSIANRLSFDASGTTRSTYETIAETAGLRIVFDSRLPSDGILPFKIENVSVLDAFDFLVLQTRTIWQMTDRDTVLVAPDTPTVRADLLPKVTKTITLPTQSGTPHNLTDLVIALRTLLNLRQVSTLDNSIVITDTAENIAFTEKMLKELDTPAAR
jgi:hypothetical protein